MSDIRAEEDFFQFSSSSAFYNSSLWLHVNSDELHLDTVIYSLEKVNSNCVYKILFVGNCFFRYHAVYLPLPPQPGSYKFEFVCCCLYDPGSFCFPPRIFLGKFFE